MNKYSEKNVKLQPSAPVFYKSKTLVLTLNRVINNVFFADKNDEEGCVFFFLIKYIEIFVFSHTYRCLYACFVIFHAFV